MKNKVKLIGYYGSDLTHAQSAWTSTTRELTDAKKKRVGKLLKMLAENGHHTPFEKSSLHFLVTCDQASHIHLLKHRIGVSVNAESARYKELQEDRFYIPDDWPDTIQQDLIDFTNQANEYYHNILEILTPKIGRKRAKESARFFKTMNSQITMDVMFNWRSFYHFLNLRMKPDAQREIREIAEEMLRLVKNIEGNPFKETLEAFGYGESYIETLVSKTGRIWTANNLEIDGKKHFTWQEAMDNAPDGYRLPTEEEWEEEIETWNSRDSAGALESPLNLQAAGYRGYYSGSLLAVGSHGYYCSRSVSGTGASSLNFDSSSAYLYSDIRAHGHSVRYIKE